MKGEQRSVSGASMAGETRGDQVMNDNKKMIGRREFVIGAGALAGAAMLPSLARAQTAKLRAGLMMP